MAIIAVTYCSRAVVERFLNALPAALEGATSARVIVVDNASHDGTAGLVRRIAPWATVIDSGANLGYSAAINLGMRHAAPTHATYVLNPDTVPAPASVQTLVDATADERIGLAVPSVLDTHGRLQHSLRREPTIRRAVAAALLGGPRASRVGTLGEVVTDPLSYRAGQYADWATGAAVLVARRTVDAVGDWDERFFLYSEETDFALRARDIGLRLVYVPKAEVTHIGGELSTSASLWSLMTINRTVLYRKRHNATASAFYWAAVTLGEALRAGCGRTRSRSALRALLDAGPGGRIVDWLPSAG